MGCSWNLISKEIPCLLSQWPNFLRPSNTEKILNLFFCLWDPSGWKLPKGGNNRLVMCNLWQRLTWRKTQNWQMNICWWLFSFGGGPCDRLFPRHCASCCYGGEGIVPHLKRDCLLRQLRSHSWGQDICWTWAIKPVYIDVFLSQPLSSCIVCKYFSQGISELTIGN